MCMLRPSSALVTYRSPFAGGNARIAAQPGISETLVRSGSMTAYTRHDTWECRLDDEHHAATDWLRLFTLTGNIP